MPNKDLLVLNECVDSRNGKRFAKGQYFDPVPTAEQAMRLVAAKCLPVGAIKLGEDADAKTAKKLADEVELAERLAERNRAIAAAVEANERSKTVLEAARAKLASASTDAEKAGAAKEVTAAEAVAEKAAADLAAAQK